MRAGVNLKMSAGLTEEKRWRVPPMCKHYSRRVPLDAIALLLFAFAINFVAGHARIYWPAADLMPENGPFFGCFSLFVA